MWVNMNIKVLAVEGLKIKDTSQYHQKLLLHFNQRES